jgi:hypothetical protein
VKRALVFWLAAMLMAGAMSAAVVLMSPPPDAAVGQIVSIIGETWVIYALLAVPAGLCHAGALLVVGRASRNSSVPTSLSTSVLSAVLFDAIIYAVPARLFSDGVALLLLFCVVPFLLSLVVFAVAGGLRSRSHEGAA